MSIPHKRYEIIDPSVGSFRQHKWMELAKKVARRSEFPGCKMAAICVRSGRVMGCGVNKARSGISKSDLYNEKQTIHAELDLTLGLPNDVLRGCTIYVAGYTIGKNLCWCSKPCNECQKLLSSYGVRAVIYHDRVGNLYRLAL